MKLRTSVTPQGEFVYGIHKPFFSVRNLRQHEYLQELGTFSNGQPHINEANFPAGDLWEENADWIYEVPNPFPFRGVTYIGKRWADRAADNPEAIRLPEDKKVSMLSVLRKFLRRETRDVQRLHALFRSLPQPVLLSLAACSTDPADLELLTEIACKIDFKAGGRKPAGLKYGKKDGQKVTPVILNHDLFETLVNNPYLPDVYKEVMVLRPGAQGGSEIIGEIGGRGEDSHVFEYLRRNSYIPWGHYAANMADDAVRYRVEDLGHQDMEALRHLYYQRTYVRLAEELGLPVVSEQESLTREYLEDIRRKVISALQDGQQKLLFDASLWGWNFGFDFAASGYRLHASHQQIHNQFALVPASVPGADGDRLPSFACGDLIADFIEEYRQENGCSFFEDYISAIHGNCRMDNQEDKEGSLIVFEDDQVMLFVPKAQTSQWELQLMTVKPVGNILEADLLTREALDRGILMAMQILTAMGAKMITVIEFAKRFSLHDNDQRLIYSFLPKLPQSPGAFSEAQLRFINGHYPEDFAAACRLRISS